MSKKQILFHELSIVAERVVDEFTEAESHYTTGMPDNQIRMLQIHVEILRRTQLELIYAMRNFADHKGTGL